MSLLGSNVYSSRQNVMRASGDSEYVFATATLPRHVGLDFKLGSLNLSSLPSCNLEDSKQTTNRGQSCGPVSFMRREKASARAIDGLVKSGLRIKIDSALRR
jgi:hypothetical protein